MSLGYEDIEAMLKECNEDHFELNDWEMNFIDSLQYEYLAYREISKSQENLLIKIHNKVK